MNKVREFWDENQRKARGIEFLKQRIVDFDKDIIPVNDDEGNIMDTKILFKYRWYHILTGRTETNHLRVDSRLEFLEALNRWNGMDKRV